MVLLVLLTAAASATATAVLGYLLYTLRLKPALQAELVGVQNEFEARVRSGVTQAATELLPQLREQVRLGFQDALRESSAAGLVEGAAGAATGAVNLSADLIGGGLSALLGIKPRK